LRCDARGRVVVKVERHRGNAFAIAIQLDALWNPLWNSCEGFTKTELMEDVDATRHQNFAAEFTRKVPLAFYERNLISRAREDMRQRRSRWARSRDCHVCHRETIATSNGASRAPVNNLFEAASKTARHALYSSPAAIAGTTRYGKTLWRNQWDISFAR